MNEEAPRGNKTWLERSNEIEARARFDARICAELASRSSPEDLMTGAYEDGLRAYSEMGLDVIEETIKELGLSSEEAEKYTETLADEMGKIFRSGDYGKH